MKRIAILNITKELEYYSDEFWNEVAYIISDEGLSEYDYGGGVKKVYGYEKLNAREAFIIVSNVINKESAFKKLETLGYRYGKDFVWAPEWCGTDDIPSCYKMKSWQDNEANYDFSGEEGPWDYRYQYLLSILDDNCVSIMDCGAGNMSLKRMLNPMIKYYPVDYMSKYPETIVCDFNSGRFPKINVDAIFLCGILEYIVDADKFISNVCKHTKIVLMTYNALNKEIPVSSRIWWGWKNHFTEGDIIKLFDKYGFTVETEIYTEKPEKYLKLRKRKVRILNL